MNDFVPKPVEPRDLFDALIRWLPVKDAQADPKPEAALGGTAPAVPSVTPESAEPLAAVLEGDALLARLEMLPGLELGRGLSVLRGNKAKYLELLGRFIASHAEDPRHMAEALAAGNREAVRQLAHALKGVSATLGVVGIAEQAGQLNTLLRADGIPDQEQIGDLIESIDLAFRPLASVMALARRAPVAPMPSGFDLDRARQVMDELTSLLEEDNARARELAREEASLLNAALDGHFEDLENRIAEFEFERALELVERAKRRLFPAKGS